MNNTQIRGFNICLLSIQLKLKALEKALTTEQKIIYETSLKESIELAQNDKLSMSLSPEERRILLQILGQK
ncbi:hypothetical protein J0383_18810 [Flavobacterium endoglycinae]|uniref:Uncharacterized protein n=1 Tax=Flavobacterium endoglycinae TaxID=2816357 RepID=A0ABX7QD16_9FLAO|nr:hypothetical protein [Flavobacterium endoglycinae]QSW88301.1 hypothetical protein J0383_18810 [Flavobacterium endoglycinae]